MKLGHCVKCKYMQNTMICRSFLSYIKPLQIFYHFEFDVFKRVGTGACLPVCYITFPFSKSHLGTDDNIFLKLCRLNSFPFLQYNFSASTVQGVCSRNYLKGPFPLWPGGHDIRDFHDYFSRFSDSFGIMDCRWWNLISLQLYVDFFCS